MNLTISHILIIIGVIVALIMVMRLIQPKLSPDERYLLHSIQRKSPQLDSTRLYMWIKMVVHPVDSVEDLEYQKRFLEDPAQFKMLVDQFHGFGASALYPFLGFEALTWGLDAKQNNPLLSRAAAVLVCRLFPHSAEVLEDLLTHAPDQVTRQYVEKNLKFFDRVQFYRARYAYNLEKILIIIISTPRNEWYPGTSPEIRDWAQSLLNRMPKAFGDLGFEITMTGETQTA